MWCELDGLDLQTDRLDTWGANCCTPVAVGAGNREGTASVANLARSLTHVLLLTKFREEALQAA